MKISDNAPFSLYIFVFVHIPPMFSVLLTYSLKINSVLYLTILIGLTETSCWSTDLQQKAASLLHLYQTRLRISTAGLIFSILYDGLGYAPPPKKCPLPIPGPMGSTRVRTQNSSSMAVLAPLTVLCDQQTDTQITERYLGNNRLYLNASGRYFY